MTDTVPAAATGLPHPRRAFLRQLTSLPLIGGALTLIGQPTAAAEPVTLDLLEAYKTWLDHEKRFLCWEMAADPVFRRRYCPLDGDDRKASYHAIKGTLHYIGDAGHSHHGDSGPQPSARAAIVLSAVGCDWREKRR